MRKPPLLLIADDNPLNVDILRTRLEANGYHTVTATDGEEALAVARAERPDLILLDVMMPKVDGLEVCRRLKADASLPFIPVIMVTAKTDSADVVAGLDAGAEEYLAKPVDGMALVARVRSMLRIKALHDTVEAQGAELVEWNRALEARVAAQVTELERVSRLRRFFSPQLADAILGGAQDPLVTHRREITVLFLDLRGFTAFAETAEPEEIMGVLREFHAEAGRLIHGAEGTLERFTGDGMMVFFNDPVQIPNPGERAVRTAIAVRDQVALLATRWRQEGWELGLGVGIAQGYATLGAIGFEGRWDYAAIGTVTNLAARLCAEAQPGEVLVSARVYAAVETLVKSEPLAALNLKGFHRPMPVHRITALRA